MTTNHLKLGYMQLVICVHQIFASQWTIKLLGRTNWQCKWYIQTAMYTGFLWGKLLASQGLCSMKCFWLAVFNIILVQFQWPTLLFLLKQRVIQGPPSLEWITSLSIYIYILYNENYCSNKTVQLKMNTWNRETH